MLKNYFECYSFVIFYTYVKDFALFRKLINE